jgi:uncharacterized membrane protein YdjX (TVP38/TMEM64 family)
MTNTLQIIESKRLKKRIAILLFIILFVGTIIAIFTVFQGKILQLILPLMRYIQENLVVGIVIFVISFGILSCLLIPTSLLSVIGGVLFKPIYQSIVLSLLGSQVGIIISILTGKGLLRPYVLKLYGTNPKVKAVDAAIEKEGLKVVILLRLTPVFPFGVCNYILSGTCLSIMQIMIGSIIGNLPGSVLNCIFGSLIGDLADAATQNKPQRIQALTWLFTGVFSICAVVLIGMIARKALKNIVDLESIEEEVVIEPPTVGIIIDPITATNTIECCTNVVNNENAQRKKNNNYTTREKHLLWSIFSFAVISITIGVPTIMHLTPDINN